MPPDEHFPVTCPLPPVSSPSSPSPSGSPSSSSWTERLLSRAGDASAPLLDEARRLATGIALASTFGVAIGIRLGGPAIATHALGVVLGIAAVCGLAVPALAIVLALANASVDALDLSRATSRAAATAGLLLAGLAPGAALFAVTVEDAITVTMIGIGGLALAGALGMRTFVRELAPRLATSNDRGRRLAKLALPVFLVFATVLAARIWWIALPIVRGE